MGKFTDAEIGTVCLIQQLQNGRIVQISTTKEQSDLLQLFLGGLSQESKLVIMPEEYDLVLKSSLK